MLKKRKWAIARIILFLPCVTLLASFARAQKAPPASAEPEATPCAVIRNQMDRSMAEFAKNDQRFAQHSYLIVIVRAGRSEKAGTLNRDRINAIKYFFDFRRFTENVIFAETGKGKERLGSGEIYIDGKLTERFHFKYQQSRLCDSVEESW